MRMSFLFTQPSLELEPIFEQWQIHMKRLRSNGIDLRNNETQLLALARRTPGCRELIHSSSGHRMLDTGLLGDTGKVGYSGSRRWETAHGKQALIVEHNVNHVVWRVPGQSTQRAEIHQ